MESQKDTVFVKHHVVSPKEVPGIEHTRVSHLWAGSSFTDIYGEQMRATVVHVKFVLPTSFLNTYVYYMYI